MVIRAIFLVTLIFVGCGWHSPAAASEMASVRFGLTAVVVRENLRYFDQLSSYLRRKAGLDVTFVRRKSYREIMDLMEAGQVDFAWICGYPLIQTRDPEYVTFLAAPVYRGQPLYRSYIIVHRESPIVDMGDIRNGVFAYADPDSNSGHLYPRHLLAERGLRPDGFFRQTFFTYDHAESIEAVATRFADGAAVDSYIWEYINKTRPELAGQTRIIHESPDFGFPPVVARVGVAPEIQDRFRQALLDMSGDLEGQRLLGLLDLDGFISVDDRLYDGIRAIAKRVRGGTAGSR